MQNIFITTYGPSAVCLDAGDPGKGIHKLVGTWQGMVRGLSGLGWCICSGGSQHPYSLSCTAVDPCAGSLLTALSRHPFLVALAVRECCLHYLCLQ